MFANPDNTEARTSLALTYEQLGYQAESGPWRNFYLTGAMELRNGVNRVPVPSTNSPDVVRALSLETYLDYLAVRLNGPEAAGREITLNFTLPDRGDEFVIFVANGVLNYTLGRHEDDAQATVTMDRAVLDDINLGQTTIDDAISSGLVTIEGDADRFTEFLSLLDRFDFWFDIVTP